MLPFLHRTNARASFQIKLFLVFTLLTASISIILTSLSVSREIRNKRTVTNENVQLIAEQLAESIRLPLYAENRALLQQHIEKTINMPEIHAVAITGANGTLLANVERPDTPGSPPMIVKTVEVHSSNLVDSVESSMSGTPDTLGKLLGTVRIERGTADLSQAVHEIVLLSVCFAVVFWLLVSLLCYLVLQRVTRTFSALMNGIETMKNGDYTTRIEIESDDEPGRAALAINNLAVTLQERSEENLLLQEKRLDLERQMLHAQKLESLGVMAGGIAHDYNNLLQAILGNIELASMKIPADSPPQRYIANALRSGRHAAHLTSLMLTYVGKGVVAKKELNLNRLVSENAEMLTMAVPPAVSIQLFLSDELAPIMADEAHIQQVVMNILLNAAESITGQSGFVRVSTGVQDCDQNYLSRSLLDEKPEPGCFVFLEVRDNGCGMDKGTIRRLFDPFFTTKFAGRGLGMSAVIGIIKTHGGALFVESEPGKGTTFRALFPIKQTEPPATLEPALSSDIPLKHEPKTSHVRTVHGDARPHQLSGLALVVDDEKSVLKVCKKMVTLCGFTTITACNGVDAVAKFRKHADEIVVVLMDLTMPNMDGVTAMNEIFDIRPDVKVILSSGFNEDEFKTIIAGHEPSGFIRKPYSLSVLEAEMRRVMVKE